MISGDRNQKLPRTHQRWLFAVRHRLSSDLPASPLGPLIVELFAVGCFARTPSILPARMRLSPGRILPTPAKVERASQDQAILMARAPWGDSHHHFPNTASLNAKACLRRPASCDKDLTDLSGRTSGLSLFTQDFTPTSPRRTGQASLLASGSTSQHLSQVVSLRPLACW